MIALYDMSPAPENNAAPLLRLFCASMVFAFPVMVLAADEVGSAIFFILAIAGMVAMFFPVVRQPLPRNAKLIFYAVALFVGVALLSYLFVDATSINAKKLGRYARFLFVIPLYYLLRHARIPQQAFWYGMAVGAIVAGLTAINQSWWHGDTAVTVGRASGSVNAIIFGNLSLLMSSICVAGMPYFWRQHRWTFALPILAAVMGLLASLLSGSRGGWLALPAIVLLFIWFWRERIKFWQLGILGATLASIAVGVYLTPQIGVQARIFQAYQDTNNYFQSHQVNTSTGARLELWKAAWIVFQNHPLLGAGHGGYVNEKQALIDSGLIESSIAGFSHPHNEYLATMATRGLVGLITLLLLFLIPARVFFHYTKQTETDIRILGICGLTAIVAFAHFSLTGDTFDRTLSITFLTFLLAIVPTLIENEVSSTRATNAK